MTSISPDHLTTTVAEEPNPLTTHSPYLETVWTDPVTGRHGYVVIDRLVRGVSSGGLRVRAGCTLDEVRGLAAGMTRKEALHYQPGSRYIPLGGAKGGIDCAPDDPDMRGMLARFLTAVRVIVEHHWTTGEDLGIQQSVIDEVVESLGMASSIEAVYPLLEDPDAAQRRLADAFAIDVAGVSLPELVGGLGVAEAALTALDHFEIEAASATAVIQGFGSMGGATARYLARAGVRIVGIVDAHGAVVNSDGLDVERYLATRSPGGELDRAQIGPQDTLLPADAWLDIDCDILVPAAVSYCIPLEAQAKVRARIVAEAANMPVLPDAEAVLLDRGVCVIPDFVANSATNAWWWWTLFGDIEADASQAEGKVRRAIRGIVTDVLLDAQANDLTPRQAAQNLVDRHLAMIAESHGTSDRRLNAAALTVGNDC